MPAWSRRSSVTARHRQDLPAHQRHLDPRRRQRPHRDHAVRPAGAHLLAAAARRPGAGRRQGQRAQRRHHTRCRVRPRWRPRQPHPAGPTYRGRHASCSRQRRPALDDGPRRRPRRSTSRPSTGVTGGRPTWPRRATTRRSARSPSPSPTGSRPSRPSRRRRASGGLLGAFALDQQARGDKARGELGLGAREAVTPRRAAPLTRVR